MHSELLRMAADLAAREEPFVLALVVNRRPASSSQPGDMALITADGAFHGWLGGSCTQPTVVREAQRALGDGKPRLLALSPTAPEAGAATAPAAPSAYPTGGEHRPGVTFFPMTCQSGGSVEIYLEPILPAARLVIFGVSPIARALAKLGHAMNYTWLAVDAAAEPAMFAGAGRVFASGADPELAALASRGPCFAVVATMGEGDEEAIRAALPLCPAYLGVVASARRFAQVRETLLAQGVDAAALAAIRSPAGKDIGARTPEEIALSVLAEVVELRRRRTQPAATAAGKEAAQSVAGSPAPGSAAAPREDSPKAPAAGVAIDPVCGMRVEIARSRHRASHEGLTHYFCCGGCRERFLAAPDRFLAAGLAVASPAAARGGGSAA